MPSEQYAYRRGRSAHDGVRRVHALINTGHQEVIDADLAGYFDSIPHAELMKSVVRRVSDGRILRLVKMWLESPVEEIDRRGRHRRTTQAKDTGRGCPQGAPIWSVPGQIDGAPREWALRPDRGFWSQSDYKWRSPAYLGKWFPRSWDGSDTAANRVWHPNGHSDSGLALRSAVESHHRAGSGLGICGQRRLRGRQGHQLALRAKTCRRRTPASRPSPSVPSTSDGPWVPTLHEWSRPPWVATPAITGSSSC